MCAGNDKYVYISTNVSVRIGNIVLKWIKSGTVMNYIHTYIHIHTQALLIRGINSCKYNKNMLFHRAVCLQFNLTILEHFAIIELN